MKTLEEMYNDIPVGKRNAINRQALTALWGISDRAARHKISEMRRLDNGDNYVIISTSNGQGYYKTDNIKDILQFKEETTARGRHTFSVLGKINRILRTNTDQMEMVYVNKLKEARVEAGLQAKDVVTVVQRYDPSFNSSVMSGMENNRCLPTSLQLSVMAELYGKEPAELIGEEIVITTAAHKEG